MVPLTVHSGKIDDVDRRARTFNGEIFLFKNVSGLLELGEFVRNLACRYLACEDPTLAHLRYDFDEYVDRITEYQKAVTGSEFVRETFTEVLAKFGVDLALTGHSRFTMRVQPPKDSHISRNTATLGPHRDSWYCEDYAQTNWWTPWYPLEPGRALRFYTRHWSLPVDNSSQGWNLDDFRKTRAAATAAGRSFDEIKAAYPPVVLKQNLTDTPAIAVLPEPGDLLCFSLAHLHEGPSNNTERCRFSTDFRTLHIDDVADHRGAPNVDSQTTGTSIGDFALLSDGGPFQDALKACRTRNAG